MSKNLYIDLHVIQTLPPSCVNRDDTGSPKTAIYGGVTRARVSSQSWKRAMRLMFADMYTEEEKGIRTKKIVDLLAKKISELDSEIQSAEKLAKKVLEAAGIKLTEKNGKAETGALFFISAKQIEKLAELAIAHPDGKFEKEDKKELQEALKNYPSVDLALFGRMVADEPSLNYDATAQVAHAISTHAVHNEYDYFTAVDDCTSEDNSGAGHLGTVEYSSSTLYRYATVNAAELANYLGGDTPKAVKNFAEAFITSMPTGKQNTFANRTRPDAVYVTVRRDQPVNMACAFEKPITTKGGYVEQSIKALVDYAKESYEDYVNEPEMAFAVGRELESLATTMNLTKLLDELEKQVFIDLEEVTK